MKLVVEHLRKFWRKAARNTRNKFSRRCPKKLQVQLGQRKEWIIRHTSRFSLDFLNCTTIALCFPGGSVSKEFICNAGKHLQCWRPGFDPGIRKIPWRRKWQSTPLFLPGKSHGQRSPVSYSLWGRKELDITEQLSHDQHHHNCFTMLCCFCSTTK